jgi:hypothetical protein
MPYIIMDTKLTLKLNQEVIEKAKKYAASQNRSLSRLIETYLSTLVDPENESELKVPITPYVKSLGLTLPIPSDLDDRKTYRDYLEEKYR